MLEVTQKDNAVTFKVRVQPRASRSELAGVYGDAVKVRLAAPPVDGKANAECRKFFAALFNLAPSAVEIIAGEASRDKLIRIHGISRDQFLRGIKL